MNDHYHEPMKLKTDSHEISGANKVIEGRCCHEPADDGQTGKKKKDTLLISTSIIILLSYSLAFSPAGSGFLPGWLHQFSSSVYDLINTMFWGIALGILFIGILAHIPREYIIALLGRKGGFTGLIRATLAGVLLDLCSHGILMVGAKLYERGTTVGQTMAFLIASPWNSISLTLILWAMVGFKWMITFLLLSMVVAFVSGLLFESLVQKGILPENPNRIDLPEDYNIVTETKTGLKHFKLTTSFVKSTLWQGLLDSRMVIRWIFFGVILAALIRTFVAPEHFQTYFGPTLIGLGLTLLVATVLEVCSEGTLPVAADLLTRAAAPGNSLTFLMAGVSTDYTEIMVLREVTHSWKIPLFLPLITLPQILILGVLLNLAGT